MHEYPDSEVINLVCDNSEDARDFLYNKYSYIVDIIVNKYKKRAYYLGIEKHELRQEALLGFSDALVRYNQERDVNLQTFISLCVERRVSNIVRNADTKKNQTSRKIISLDQTVDSEGERTIIDLIGNSIDDPQIKLERIENLEQLKSEIDECLSPTEKNVYELLLNNFTIDDIASILNKDAKSVYNTIQRMRQKIKSILSNI